MHNYLVNLGNIDNRTDKMLLKCLAKSYYIYYLIFSPSFEESL